MGQTYRVAVFGHTGQGNYGHGLDTAWLTVPETRIVAVCDPDEPGRAAEAGKLHVDKAFASYEQMLDEMKPDIVAICPRWVTRHRDVAVAAANRGIHIYIEKPFCRSPAEADEIVTACEMTHARLAIAHPTHYSPKIDTIRRLIRDGAIGDVIGFEGRGKEDRRGGAEDLWVLGSHILDMILALGYQPEWCFARMTQDGVPVTRQHVSPGNEGLGPLAGDAIHAVYGLTDGVTASFQTCRGAGGQPSRYGLRILGSAGVIELYEGTLPEAYILQNPGWSTSRGAQSWKRVSSAGIDVPEPLSGEEYTSRHGLPIRDLLYAIEHDREPKCGMYQGRTIVEMTTAVFESHRLGRPVTFPLQTRENPLALL